MTTYLLFYLFGLVSGFISGWLIGRIVLCRQARKLMDAQEAIDNLPSIQ